MTARLIFSHAEMNDLVRLGYVPEPSGMRMILPNKHSLTWTEYTLREVQDWGTVLTYEPVGLAQTEQEAREWLMQKA